MKEARYVKCGQEELLNDLYDEPLTTAVVRQHVEIRGAHRKITITVRTIKGCQEQN